MPILPVLPATFTTVGVADIIARGGCRNRRIQSVTARDAGPAKRYDGGARKHASLLGAYAAGLSRSARRQALARLDSWAAGVVRVPPTQQTPRGD